MNQHDGRSILAPGTSVGDYTVTEHVASGGMADIYLVTARNGHHRVALKCLRARHQSDTMYRQMLVDEAALMRRLTHPNIVRVADTRHADQGYFTLEYVDGAPLSGVLDRAIREFGGLPLNIVVAVMFRVSSALDYAHSLRDPAGRSLGVVHRDVSPANILVGFDGAVKLADFGVARARSRQQETGSNLVKGKMGYMSPEQVLGQPLDRRSDVFAMGIVLHEMLTGTRLFAHESDYECLRQIVSEPVVPPSMVAPRVSPQLDSIVLRALEKDPARRYQDAHEVLVDLIRVADDRLDTANPTIAGFMGDLFHRAGHDTCAVSPSIVEVAPVTARRHREAAIVADTDPAVLVDAIGWTGLRERGVQVPELWDVAEGYLAVKEYEAAAGAYEYLMNELEGDAGARAGFYEAAGHLAMLEGRVATAQRYLRWSAELRARGAGQCEAPDRAGAGAVDYGVHW